MTSDEHLGRVRILDFVEKHQTFVVFAKIN